MTSPPGSDSYSIESNIERAKAYFEPRPALHGDSYLAADWGSQKGQFDRFAALQRITPLNNCHILDVGCGMGHLLDWVRMQGLALRSYEGIDVTPSMVAAARARHPDATFHECDVLLGGQPHQPSYDVVFASGIFYLALDKPYHFLEAMLRRLFHLADQALVFNLLTASSHDDCGEAGEFRADTAQVIAIISSLSPYFSLDHTYSRADATIAIFKKSR